MGEYAERFNAILAAELRAQRARKKMTYDELAAATGLSKVTVLRYLNEQREMGVQSFVELCIALGADPDNLFRIAQEQAQQI